MSTNTKILLYDDYCPLCSWYSGLFVKWGLLDPASRVAFSKADLAVLTAIDMERGKDEIPLFDPATLGYLLHRGAIRERNKQLRRQGIKSLVQRIRTGKSHFV